MFIKPFAPLRTALLIFWAAAISALPAQATALSVSSAVSTASTVSAQAYWQRFRMAVVKQDHAALHAMVKLPLRIRGEMDNDPVRKISARGLNKAMAEILAQTIYSSQGKSTSSSTLREVIVQTEQLPAKAMLTPTSFRVEQLEFQLVGQQWKLAQAYLGE